MTRRQDSGSAALLSSVVWSHPDRNTLCTTSCCVNLCSIPYTAPEEIVPHGTDTRHDTLEGGLVCVAKSNLDRMKGGQIFFFLLISYFFAMFSNRGQCTNEQRDYKGCVSKEYFVLSAKHTRITFWSEIIRGIVVVCVLVRMF